MLPSDHAFTAFIAGSGVERLEGEERRMFRFFEHHRSLFVASVEAQINDYKEKK